MKYSIGIEYFEALKVTVKNNDNGDLNTIHSDFFKCISFISKHADLNNSVVFIQGPRFLDDKINSFKSISSNASLYWQYTSWRNSIKKWKKLPAKYDTLDFQADTFRTMDQMHERSKKAGVLEVLAKEFKSRGVLVVICENSTVSEKMEQDFNISKTMPGSYPGLLNDNYQIK